MFSRHVVGELSCYLDGELSEKEKSVVETHLKDCSACSGELARLKILSETLKSWQVPEPSGAFDDTVRDKIVLSELERGQVKMDRKTLHLLVPSGVLAGILVLVLFSALTHKANIQLAGIKDERTTAEEVSRAGSQYAPYYLNSGYRTSQMNGAASRREGYARSGPVDLLETAARTTDAIYAIMDKGDTGVAFQKARVNADAQSRGFSGSGPATASALVALSSPELPLEEGSVIVIQPTLPATGEGEKIIRTAEVRLEVEDGREAYKKLMAVCQEAGGYIAASQLNRDNEDRAAGFIVMRIPKARFTEVLDKLRDSGQVKDINTSSEDVGQHYKNLKVRLDAEMVVYNKILEALKRRQKTISEALQVQSELTPVLSRIETLKNQLEALDNAVSFTTITVYFNEPQVSAKILQQSGRLIRESLMATSFNIVKFIARVLPRAVGIAAVLLIAGVAGAFLKAWIVKTFKRD